MPPLVDSTSDACLLLAGMVGLHGLAHRGIEIAGSYVLTLHDCEGLLLGFMIVWGRQLFQLDLVLAAIIAVGLVGLALDKGLALIESRLLHWRQDVSFESKAVAR